MKNKTFTMLIGVGIMFILCSCGTTHYVTEDRNFPTEIEPQEAVVIILNTYSKHDVCKESRSSEQGFEGCVRNSMIEANPKIKIVSAKDFRRMVFNGRSFEDTPRSPKDILSFFHNQEAHQQLAKAEIRYLIVLNVITSNTKKQFSLEPTEHGAVFGRKGFRYTRITAIIIDMKRLKESGRVTSTSTGPAGYGVGLVMFILPVPFGYTSPTETATCSRIGEEILNFIVGRGESKPHIEGQNGE
ncbi:MAG: hypothetical protein JRJ39_04670 [Deltaproteobacteria bacterium]|nr:hypothetical protein [Deltaproteobacteria bacterium]